MSNGFRKINVFVCKVFQLLVNNHSAEELSIMKRNSHISKTIQSRELCLTFSKNATSKGFRIRYNLNSTCLFLPLRAKLLYARQPETPCIQSLQKAKTWFHVTSDYRHRPHVTTVYMMFYAVSMVHKRYVQYKHAADCMANA